MTSPSENDPTVPLGGTNTPKPTLNSREFRAGTIWAERYRLIAALGAGGMGQVFRAEDLELKQEVAIKFLNVAASADPQKVDALRSEVRTARLVTHPNVCRVHDFGDVEGQTFLTMEYVDGEDLGSLMRRIGQLPKEKALQSAMQIASGLNSAHERGVIHRDLKPGNVMIDSAGDVRLTDFGLAASLESLQQGHSIAGTPAYMAPELFAGAAPSVASDMYSLGVLLFELFAGARPFDGDSIESLLASHRSVERPSLLAQAPDIDPDLAQVISRCLALDPRRRPQSAVEVLAALPGWDPLRDSISRGETPSPLMVAAARGAGRVPAKRANWILAITLAGIALVYSLVATLGMVERASLELPGSVLAEDARRILDDLGYPRAEAAYEVWAFDAYEELIFDLLDSREPDKWDVLDRRRPSPFDFYYRRSPQPIVMSPGALHLGWEEPPVRAEGMVQVRLDPLGGLRELRVVPIAFVTDGPPAESPDWEKVFEHADLEFGEFAGHPVAPQLRPAHYADQRLAWLGTYPESGQEVRVEAATLNGNLVAFRVLEVENLGPALPSNLEHRENVKRPETFFVFDAFMVVIGISAIVFAFRSLARKRTDFRGANRCAVFLFVLVASANFLMANHVANVEAEVRVLINALARGLLKTGFFWLLYVGYEPHVRRIWPELLVSWTRVFQRRGKDPLVWSHVMAGIGMGSAVAFLEVAYGLVGDWLGVVSPPPVSQDMATAAALDGPAPSLGAMLHLCFRYFGFGINAVMTLVLLRLLFRRTWLAISGAVVVFTLLFFEGLGGNDLVMLPLSIMQGLIIVLANARYGLLGAAVGASTFGILLGTPATLDISKWYAGSGLLSVGVLSLTAIYAWKQIRDVDEGRPTAAIE